MREINNKKAKKLWIEKKKVQWENIWRNSLYSIADMIDGDKWVGIKYSPLLPYIMRYAP